jgi:TatD DNase family protein
MRAPRTNLVMMIDTHTHLTDEPLALDLPAVLARARARGVTACIVPGYDNEVGRAARALAQQHAGVHVAIGVHPLFVGRADVAALAQELAQGGIVAIGETGLDYADARADRAAQQQCFHAQLDLALAHDLPVIIHCRQAHDDVLRVLRAVPRVRGVLHSCSCSHEQIKPFLDLGLYVSVSGVITRATTQKAKKLAAIVPCARLLAETDSPYIGNATHPAPTSEPADVADVIAALAAVKQVSCEEMARITSANARALFGAQVV